MVVRYASAAPNGTARGIAGICSEAGNVVGLMPHPEHAIDPLTGPSADGLGFFTSAVTALHRSTRVSDKDTVEVAVATPRR